MINNNNGKIVIETKEDKRLEVAIELAKTVNNLSEMLKNMDTSISNIHINGCNIQTAQGETALYMGNGVKNSSVTNSIFQTDFHHPTREELAEEYLGDDEEDDWDDEERQEYDHDDENVPESESEEE